MPKSSMAKIPIRLTLEKSLVYFALAGKREVLKTVDFPILSKNVYE